MYKRSCIDSVLDCYAIISDAIPYCAEILYGYRVLHFVGIGARYSPRSRLLKESWTTDNTSHSVVRISIRQRRNLRCKRSLSHSPLNAKDFLDAR